MSHHLLALRQREGWTGGVAMVHADLGRAEWQTTPDYVRDLADRKGVPLYIVRWTHGGRRTLLRNRDVQMMLESMIDVWADELVSAGRIELENFFVLETQAINRGENLGSLNNIKAPRYIHKLAVRGIKKLKRQINSMKKEDMT
jgi:hypothetical protein